MPPAPAASQGEWGLGQSPKGLFFVFEVVRVDVTVQKVKKMCIFRIFATKKHRKFGQFRPHPTLTGVSNQKRVYLPSEYTKNNSPKVVLKDTESVLFLCQKDTKKPLKTPLIYRYRKRTIKSPMKSENNA